MRGRNEPKNGNASRPPYRSAIVRPMEALLEQPAPTPEVPRKNTSEQVAQICDELDLLLVPTRLKIQSFLLDMSREEAQHQGITHGTFVRDAIICAVQKSRQWRRLS
jgi:hypothetical protein